VLTKQLTLAKPLWLLTAGAKAQRCRWFTGRNWKVSKPLDSVVLQHSVIVSGLVGEVLTISDIRFFKKLLVLSKQKKRKLVKMRSFPLKSANPNGDGCVMYSRIYVLKGRFGHLKRCFLWSTIKLP